MFCLSWPNLGQMPITQCPLPFWLPPGRAGRKHFKRRMNRCVRSRGTKIRPLSFAGGVLLLLRNSSR